MIYPIPVFIRLKDIPRNIPYTPKLPNDMQFVLAAQIVAYVVIMYLCFLCIICFILY